MTGHVTGHVTGHETGHVTGHVTYYCWEYVSPIVLHCIGFFVGQEGPMVYIGSVIGAGLPQVCACVCDSQCSP